MGILIDSNILIDLERQEADVGRRIKDRKEEEFFISVITASEILHGVHRTRNAAVRAQRLAFVESVLTEFPVLLIDLATARSHAQLSSELESKGRMIGVHDSWLAATCLAHGLGMVTANTREFRNVPGLRLEVWD
jgi:tRNA(fMet)-specific endonuclease VapC